MRIFLLLVVVGFITCATTRSGYDYRSIEDSSSLEENLSSSPEENSSYSSIESVGCKISYKYTLWIGDDVDDVHSIDLQSKCGTVFLNAMQQAAEIKEEFAFEYTKHPFFGTFVTKIDGVSNDDKSRTYWMIYDLTEEPDVDIVPSDEYLCSVGVSSLEVLDGHSYLFWYKTVNEVQDEDYN